MRRNVGRLLPAIRRAVDLYWLGVGPKSMLRNPSSVSDDEVAMPQGVLSTAHLCDADAVTRGGKAAETQFRALLDVLPAAIYVTDANGHITYYNQAAVDLAGRRPELGTDEWCVSWR